MRKLPILLTLWLFPLLLSAQTQAERVAITPLVGDNLGLPTAVNESLGTKLMQMATTNGFGATGGDLVLTAKVNMVDKQVTATAPAQFVVELETSVYVVSLAENIVIAETSFVTKAIDKNENKAIAKAVSQINTKSPIVRNFMNSVREGVVDYYTTRVPAIMAQANSLAKRGEYDAAIAALSAIPQSLDDYPTVAERMSNIYIEKLDKMATMSIQNAKAAIALGNYEEALSHLVYVHPYSAKLAEADALVAQIKRSLDKDGMAQLQEQLDLMTAKQQATQQELDLLLLAQEASESVDVDVDKEKKQAELNKWLNKK